eukprot:TRINITY_DN53954_c0_g1_i1.p1 TRINITY_DN53954_c0_g1~~TRINITY_DN53954_c0_g1_i1.p1  ORF type:complete len:332 (+),score=22.56 TRINITY_DN53954_c0_g1_i1:137-1132(+)
MQSRHTPYQGEDPVLVKADPTKKNPRRNKQPICLDYLNGTCNKKRDECKFAHPTVSVPFTAASEKEICPVFAATGFCKFQAKCNLRHVEAAQIECAPAVTHRMNKKTKALAQKHHKSVERGDVKTSKSQLTNALATETAAHEAEIRDKVVQFCNRNCVGVPDCLKWTKTFSPHPRRAALVLADTLVSELAKCPMGAPYYPQHGRWSPLVQKCLQLCHDLKHIHGQDESMRSFLAYFHDELVVHCCSLLREIWVGIPPKHGNHTAILQFLEQTLAQLSDGENLAVTCLLDSLHDEVSKGNQCAGFGARCLTSMIAAQGNLLGAEDAFHQRMA